MPLPQIRSSKASGCLTFRNDWEICGEAADGQDALAKLSELSPDVVILDLSMPGLNGFETASEMRRIAPFTRIILFSIHEIPVSTRAAGAEAFGRTATARNN